MRSVRSSGDLVNLRGPFAFASTWRSRKPAFRRPVVSSQKIIFALRRFLSIATVYRDGDLRRVVPKCFGPPCGQDGLPRSMNVRAASMYQASHVEQFAPVPHSVTEAKSASSLTRTCVSLPRYVRSAPPQPDSCTAANSIGIRSPSPRGGASDIRRTKRYGKSSRSSAETSSLRLDVGGPDHLAPFFSFLLKPPPVIRGRAASDGTAQVGKPHLQFGVRQRGVNLLVEFVDDLGRRVFGCADTYPCSRIVARHKLAQGWHIRQHLRARRSGDRQCAHFAALDVLRLGCLEVDH